MSRNVLLSLALLGTAATLGCNKNVDGDPPYAVDPHLARFSSCEELRAYVTDAYIEMLVQARYGWGARLDGGDDFADADGTGAESAADGPSDYSETNVQEKGVDEADIVKTDGQYVYVAQHSGELTIVRSWPVASAEVVGRLQASGWPYGMFLDGDRVVLISLVYDWDHRDDVGVASSDYRHGYATRITLIDVADRTAPQVVREIDIEGWYVDARRLGDDVYAVISSWADMPWTLWNLVWDGSIDFEDVPWDASEDQLAAARADARAKLRPHVEAAVDALAIDQILPRVFDRLPDEVGEGEALMDCTEVYRPDGLSRPSMLSVVHLGLEEPSGSSLSATGLMSEGWTVYASQDNLYIAQSSMWWWWGWGSIGDLSTHVHRFSLDGPNTAYEASGAIDGWLLNQFSMSEHDGHLRVATTDHDWWGWGVPEEEAGGNNVFILEQAEGELRPVGEVRGIAPGERIYAARFQGDRGYMVTFRDVDPLFTLDLADPTDPRVVGELKIPGFSSYLHPVGDGHLLAVGMHGDWDGMIHGLAVSLFDITDFANPKLQDQIVFESDWSWSEALWNHHAFTFHRDVMAIPFYSYEHGDGWWNGFSGMLTVDVDTETGLAEIGRIDHKELVDDSECLYAEYGWGCSDYWWAQMRRSVIIEDNLFSISDYGIRVTDLNDPEVEHARVLFWPL